MGVVSHANPVDRRVAVGLSTVTVLFSALIQLESYVLYARSGGLSADAAFAMVFPFLHVDAIVLGALLGGAWLLAGRSRQRGAVIAGALLVNLWPIVNQVAYGILRQNVSLYDPDVAPRTMAVAAPLLARSVPPAAVWLAIANTLVLAAAAVWVRRHAVRASERPATLLLRRRAIPIAATAVAVYAAAAFVSTRLVDARGLDRHAVVALLRPVDADPVWRARDASKSGSMPQRLVFGTAKPDDAAVLLADAVASARSLSRPNVLLVILESIGSGQMFPAGIADSTLTPNIARLARGAVLFPNIYPVSPATTLAHVPMMTGGPTMITADEAQNFAQPYVGATLPGEMRRLGYRNGLFAAAELGYAELDRFYGLMPWDTVLHAGQASGPLAGSPRANPWGVGEGLLWTHARRWVELDKSPFFLNFQTIATHFPYATPSTFRGPRADTDAESRYANAIAYTDAALGRVLSDLESRGELERTIVVLTGDHGETFGKVHPQNVTHRNFIYDENIRSFLLFAVPGLRQRVVSSRVGTHADLMPSLLALLGATTDVSGRNLFAQQFTPRPVHFFKGAPPRLWGLRDGQWKFIDRMAGGAAELFDLDRDADEQTNLAGQHAEMVTAYRDMLNAWFARTNQDFLSHFRSVDTSSASAATGNTPWGIRDVRVGADSRAQPPVFIEVREVPRHARPLIMIRWTALDRATTVRVRLVSPSRRFWVFPILIDQPWSETRFAPPLSASEPGRWTVDVWTGARKLGRAVFDVP